MAKVETPVAGYSGPGPGGAVFVDGVAEVDDESALNYYRGAGYAVDGETDNPVERLDLPDPREVTLVQVGSELRDAAVDPAKSDFLAPTNAGKANPHGDQVVNPEIHASGPAGITSGVVFVEDAAKQEKRETDRARARLVNSQTAAAAVALEVPNLDDRGDLDLSDPGSADAGRAAAAQDDADADQDHDSDPAAAPTFTRRRRTRGSTSKD